MFEFKEEVKEAKMEKMGDGTFSDDLQEPLEMDIMNETAAVDEASDVSDGTDIADMLGLTPGEREVFESMDFEAQVPPMEGTTGKGKVHGSCVSTSCVSTTVPYYCAYTK